MALVGKISIAMGVATQGLESGLNKARSSIQGFGSSIGGIGAAIGGALAGGAAVAGIYKMVTAAGDLNESINKTEVVFGSASKEVIAQSNKMAEAFGASQNSMLAGGSQLGGLFKGVGFSENAVAGLSNQFVLLAKNSESLHNIGFDITLQKIRAGLSGESEPLRELGVFLTEAGVKAEAFATGLAKPGEELSNQAKVAARAQLIMRGLADAQGDLAKTADSFSNASREASGRVENLAATVGQALLPVAAGAFGQINTALEALSLAWEDNKTAVLSWATGTVGGIGEAAGSVGFLQTAIGKIADVWQAVGLGFKAFQSYVTEGISLIASGMGNFFSLLDRGLSALGAPTTGLGAFFATWSEDLDRLANDQWKGFMDDLAKPPASEGVNDYFQKAQDKIKALRGEFAGKQGELNLAGEINDHGAAKKEKARDQFATATTQGSAEAASIILKSRYGDTKSSAENKTADNTAKMVDKFDKLLAFQEQLIQAFGTNNTPDLMTLDSLAIL